MKTERRASRRFLSALLALTVAVSAFAGCVFAPAAAAEEYEPAEYGFTAGTDGAGITDPNVSLSRISGANRCVTAAAISERGFASAETVVIASGTNYADALAGTSLAYALAAPILLAAGNEPDEATAAEILRLGASEAVILGGGKAVSPEYEDALVGMGLSVRRLSGATRLETAVRIAEELGTLCGAPSELFVVSGENYPDALAVGCVAALKGSPVLYSVKSGAVDPATAAFAAASGAQKVTIIGGSASVGTPAEAALRSAAGVSPKRIGGTDRFDTDLKILNEYKSLFTGKPVVLATGLNYPDALAGGVLAAREGAPVLLAGNALTETQYDYLFGKAPAEICVLGGTGAVANTVAYAARYGSALGRAKVSSATNDAKAAAIVSAMTLQQRVGQMMPSIRTYSSKNLTALNDSIRSAIKKYGIGGFILFAENTQGTEQTARLVNDLQRNSAAGLSRMNMLISIDQEGGSIIRLKTGTNTCGSMAVGALGDTAAASDNAAIIGSELAALGINTDFAPVLDVNSNPANPVIGVRSFSSSPDLVSTMGKAYISGLHGEGVAAALKHFPGHGDTATDSHTGLPLVNKTRAQLDSFELVPFKAAIDAGADLVMTAHIQYPQIETGSYKSTSTGKPVYLPATLSKTIITGILRGDLGYDGVVTTDAMNMGAIAQNFAPADAAALAINAGVDILLMPVEITSQTGLNNLGAYISTIVTGIDSGKISKDNVTKSAQRIVKLKLERGILYNNGESAAAAVTRAKAVVGSKAHHDKELEIAEKAVTVVKNTGSVLPLKPVSGERVTIFYPYNGEQNSINYAVGNLRSAGRLSSGVSISVCGYRSATVNDFSTQISKSTAVVVFTEAYSQSYLDEKSSNGWQAVFVDALITRAHSLGKKVILVSANLPYDAARYTSADAVLFCYGAKDMSVTPTSWNGEVVGFGPNIIAAVDVVFGKTSPKGKLPVDIPALDDSRNYTSTILYKRGTGLSW